MPLHEDFFMQYFVVGAGLWGCVVAERIASVLQKPVTVIEKRPHAGGNCHSFVDSETGIECHQYGSHIFHTSLASAHEYLAQFWELTNYRHKVLITHNNRVYAMPVNLFTINAFYNKNFTPQEAREFLAAEIARDKVDKPANLEQKAISLIGRPLYEAFIKNYTTKQWRRPPAELPESIINRLPVRNTYNMDYFNDKWQGVPLEGYGALFKKLLANKNITLKLNCDYFQIRNELPRDAAIIYTGMPDQLFDYKYGQLEWRSLRFEWQAMNLQDFQGTSVMNYADLDAPWTRIHEFKHYHPERTVPWNLDKTVICREYPDDWHAGKEAYYPVNNAANTELYAQYEREGARNPHLVLGGRLGSYRYWDMDKAVANALEVFEKRIVGMEKE